MNMLRAALLGLTALVAIILGWSAWRGPADGPDKTAERSVSPQEIAAQRRALERLIAATPDYASVFERLKSTFPTEYEAFLAAASERSARTGGSPSADALMIEAARALRRTHGVLAARADGPALDRYFDSRHAVLSALAADDRGLCVDFLYGGGHGDFIAFSQGHRGLLAALVGAGLEAISDGRGKREVRGPPTEEDFRSLENALRAQGVSNAAISALLDGKMTTPPLDDAEMCAAGEIYLKTLAALPEASRLRIYGLAVALMARS